MEKKNLIATQMSTPRANYRYCRHRDRAPNDTNIGWVGAGSGGRDAEEREDVPEACAGRLPVDVLRAGTRPAHSPDQNRAPLACGVSGRGGWVGKKTSLQWTWENSEISSPVKIFFWKFTVVSLPLPSPPPPTDVLDHLMQVHLMSRAFGRGLTSLLGVQPGDRISMYAETR